MVNIELNKVQLSDLDELWAISYGPKADLKWMAYDGPYFENPVLDRETFLKGWGEKIVNQPNYRLIICDKQMIGLVTAYWEDAPLNQWLEVGMVIYNADLWGNGIGSLVLKFWLKEMFDEYPQLPHLSFTTWSGNIGMQKVGEHAGMLKEGVIRKVRYWQGEYYDSVKYGILREEMGD